MMSNTSSSTSAPLSGATLQSRAVPDMPASMVAASQAAMASSLSSSSTSNPGFISTTGLTSTGLPLTGDRSGLSQTGLIAPLRGADAMMAPVAGGVTLPAPIILGTHTSTSTTAMPAHQSHHTATAAPLATHTAAPLQHHQQPMLHQQQPHLMHQQPIHQQPIAPAAPLPMTTTTTTTMTQPAMMTTTTTDSHHGGHHGGGLMAHLPGHHGGSDMSSTDKKLLKEREKEQHRLAKEQEKLAKEREHEQKQHEKDARKHEKEVLKEQEHAAKEHEKLAKKQHKEELKAAKHGGHHATGFTGTTTGAYPATGYPATGTAIPGDGFPSKLPVGTAQPGLMHGGHGATPLPGSHPTATTTALPVTTGAPLGAVMASKQQYGGGMLSEGQAAAVDIAKQQQLAQGGLGAQPIGMQQPVGAINMADPPRHVF